MSSSLGPHHEGRGTFIFLTKGCKAAHIVKAYMVGIGEVEREKFWGKNLVVVTLSEVMLVLKVIFEHVRIS